jgi:hypothetical protein
MSAIGVKRTDRRVQLLCLRNIRISAAIIDFAFCNFSIAKSQGIRGVQSNRLVVIGNRSNVIVLITVNIATLIVGRSSIGIEPDPAKLPRLLRKTVD